MAESNFQDVVVLSSASLQVRGQAVSIGTDAGAKSVIFANDVGALSLAANPTTTRTITIPDANGTLGLITAISAGTTLVSNGQVVFSNSNGFTFGLNGSTITASYTQSTGPAAISAGTTLASSGTIVFSNSNSITFGMNGNTITASFSQTVQPTVQGLGVSTGGNTAGNTGTVTGTVVLAGVGGVSLSQSTAAGIATISISMTQSTAPAAIAAGTQTATSGTIVFSNSNGVTFGMSNSSVITASVQTQAARISMFSQYGEFATNQAVGAGSLSIQKFSIPMAIHATQAVLGLILSGNSNSSGALTVSMAIYTINGGTALSLASSNSRQISWTSGSDTSASSRYGGVSGTRYRTVGFDVSLTPGDYMLAYNFSTTNDGTWRALGRLGVNLVGTYDGVETSLYLDGYSTSTTAAFPASVALTDTGFVRTTPQAQMQPGAIMVGS